MVGDPKFRSRLMFTPLLNSISFKLAFQLLISPSFSSSKPFVLLIYPRVILSRPFRGSLMMLTLFFFQSLKNVLLCILFCLCFASASITKLFFLHFQSSLSPKFRLRVVMLKTSSSQMVDHIDRSSRVRSRTESQIQNPQREGQH